MKRYDAIVIGGGVVGCATARELSRYDLTVALIEKEEDVGWGTSSRNTGVVHAGFSHQPGSLKAALCREGNRDFEALSRELDVPYKKLGKCVVALADDEIPNVEALAKRGEQNGVPGLSIIGKEKLRELEPNLNGVAALYSAESAVTNPFLLTIALAESAKRNGVDFYLSSPVTGVKKNGAVYRISTPAEEFEADWVINSAGLFADEISRSVGIDRYRIQPYRGEYLILDRRKEDIVNHLIYPAAHKGKKGGWGTHVVPTVDGNILIGPTIEGIQDKTDFAVTGKKLGELFNEASGFLPGFSRGDLIRTFAGLRPKIPNESGEFQDFIIEEDRDYAHFINLVGMESPALTACQAIARRVVGMIDQKAHLQQRTDFYALRKAPTDFSELGPDEQRAAIEEMPDHGDIVCRCEQVTRREIIEAARNPLGAMSLISLKYRTRAMTGRCQGGYCLPKIVEILRQELGYLPLSQHLRGPEAYLFSRERTEGGYSKK